MQYNRATTSFSYCPSTAFLPGGHCTIRYDV